MIDFGSISLPMLSIGRSTTLILTSEFLLYNYHHAAFLYFVRLPSVVSYQDLHQLNYHVQSPGSYQTASAREHQQQ
jgi:hypothetical protein